jgi:hypothetical protein
MLDEAANAGIESLVMSLALKGVPLPIVTIFFG